MTAPKLPPIATAPYQPPAHLEFFFDPNQRFLRVSYRGALDLASSTLDIPAGMLKQIVAQVIGLEGSLEMQQKPRVG